MSQYVSQEGLEELKRKLEHLKTTKRKEVAGRLEHAKTLGDLSENAEYQEAKEEQSLIETQIIEMEEKIRAAIVISKEHRIDQVDIGSTVIIDSERGQVTYTIVGSEEANPLQGKISNDSPIGKAFLGHKVGETVEVKTPAGMKTYKILEIK